MKSSLPATIPRLSLAERREALITDCALQRLALSVASRELLMPLQPGNLASRFASRLKIPLLFGGAALGLLAARSGRILPVLSTGTAVLQGINGALPLIQRLGGRLRNR
ncbi:hypothetical protein [Janthinobacterium agaricidamnosum]|uniref:Uncharacterized protein n=1 Tax=Janthinobacterium agaricidamnosum NBRC 102515 = DSM 9628 TaxID=1349767 RepID=W0VBY9_9BURK|nr:hypothetical protein [Janthinobacterium agaricidamnosum]CDG85145.1 hypothetical protein GJA_4538 [Janthinobacterium agaricidamnosum NBRC 102515 = DSM 9628]